MGKEKRFVTAADTFGRHVWRYARTEGQHEGDFRRAGPLDIHQGGRALGLRGCRDGHYHPPLRHVHELAALDLREHQGGLQVGAIPHFRPRAARRCCYDARPSRGLENESSVSFEYKDSNQYCPDDQCVALYQAGLVCVVLLSLSVAASFVALIVEVVVMLQLGNVLSETGPFGPYVNYQK